MYINDIYEDKRKKFIVVYAKDHRFENIVEDLLLDAYRLPKSVVIRPKGDSDINGLIANGYSTPLGFNRWLYIVNSDTHLAISRDVFDKIIRTETATFVIFVNNFKSFNYLMRLVDKSADADKLTLTYLNFHTVHLLIENHYRNLATTDIAKCNLNTIGLKVAKGYGSKPNICLDILDYIIANQTEELTSGKVTKMFGPPDNTIDRYVLKLLTSIPKDTGRSLKSLMNKRSKEAVALMNEYNPEYLRKGMINTVRDILKIKSYYIEGRLYKKISQIKDAEDSDINHLKKYNRELDTIKSIQLSRIITLFYELTSTPRWNNEVDFFDFLYRYMNKIVKEL